MGEGVEDSQSDIATGTLGTRERCLLTALLRESEG